MTNANVMGRWKRVIDETNNIYVSGEIHWGSLLGNPVSQRDVNLTDLADINLRLAVRIDVGDIISLYEAKLAAQGINVSLPFTVDGSTLQSDL